MKTVLQIVLVLAFGFCIGAVAAPILITLMGRGSDPYGIDDLYAAPSWPCCRAEPRDEPVWTRQDRGRPAARP